MGDNAQGGGGAAVLDPSQEGDNAQGGGRASIWDPAQEGDAARAAVLPTVTKCAAGGQDAWLRIGMGSQDTEAPQGGAVGNFGDLYMSRTQS